MAKKEFIDLINSIGKEVSQEFDKKNNAQVESQESTVVLQKSVLNEPVRDDNVEQMINQIAATTKKNNEQKEKRLAWSSTEVKRDVLDKKNGKKPPIKYTADLKNKLYNEIHKKHRERVRKAAEVDTDLATFADHEILEYLLHFSIPRIDTNPLAHYLLDRFGSLNSVIQTPKDVLLEIPNITEISVALFRAIVPIVRRIEASRVQSIRKVESIKDAVEVLKPLFINRQVEVLYMLCLDVNDNVVGIEKISEGDVNFTDFNVKKITLAVPKHGATKVILAHNHPGGTFGPSTNDIDSTSRLQLALQSTSVILSDHIIFTQDAYFSFHQHSLMGSLYKASDQYFQTNVCQEYYSRLAKKKHNTNNYVLEKELITSSVNNIADSEND